MRKLLLLALLVPVLTFAAGVTVTVSKGERNLQKFKFWEIVPYLGQDLVSSGVYGQYSPTVIAGLLDANVTAVRIGIHHTGSGATLADLDLTEFDLEMNSFIVPFRAAALARGMTPLIVVQYVTFGAPDRATVFQTDSSGYATLMSSFIDRMYSTWGLGPDYWCAILEPDNHLITGSFVGWTGAQLAANYVALRTAVATAGHHVPMLIGPTTTSQACLTASCTVAGTPVAAYITDMMGTAGMSADYILSFDYHTYTGTGTQANIPGVTEAYKKESGLTESMSPTASVLMTDFTTVKNVIWDMYSPIGINTTGDNSGIKPTCALQASGTTPSNGSQLSWYWVADTSGGTPTLTLCDNGKRVLAAQSAIKPGATQLYASSSDSAKVIAYANPDGTWGIVHQCTASCSAQTYDFTGNWPAGDYTVRHLAGADTRNITTDTTATVTVANGGTISTTAPASAYDLIVIKSATVPTTARGRQGGSMTGSVQ